MPLVESQRRRRLYCPRAPARKLQLQPAENVVGRTFCLRYLRVRGEAGGLEMDTTEFLPPGSAGPRRIGVSTRSASRQSPSGRGSSSPPWRLSTNISPGVPSAKRPTVTKPSCSPTRNLWVIDRRSTGMRRRWSALPGRRRLLGAEPAPPLPDRGAVVRVRCRGVREHLTATGAVAVDGDPFTTLAISKLVSVGNVLDGGVLRKVDRLAYSVVRMALERGLHAHVPGGLYLVRRDEGRLRLLGHLITFGEAASGGEECVEVVRPEARRGEPRPRTRG